MQSRTDRHEKILELISRAEIGTQADLEEALEKSGFKVTQATLSRDIRELGLVKIASGGRYRYAHRQNISTNQSNSTTTHASLARVKRFIRNIDWSGNTVVVITDSGAAAHVAEAIDQLNMKQVLGTIAGDNTIFIVARRTINAAKLVDQLQSLIG
ncbi:MAG: arginine repressor [Cyanobacteria bacterium]|nr:arginine repressor [Cyanobacteriota bacterium]